MAEPSLEDLAQQINDLKEQIATLSHAAQLGNSSLDTGDSSLALSDAVTTAMATPAALAGLQDVLDTNEEALAATKADVAAAIEAAQEASDAGVAAGELANQAADEALQKAQEALDAAESAGGGATYTNVPPTASDPGTPGKQWFVWDSNYHITAYYVYQDDTVKWVQTVLDDGTFGNLSAGHITSGYIDAARIAAASLTAAVLAADTLTSREIGADAILARNIKAAEITGDRIAARTIAAGNIVANTITGNEIKANSLTAQQIQANSITANEINLDTLNGKTINGISITGSSLSTAATGTTSYMRMSGSSFTFFAPDDSVAGRLTYDTSRALFTLFGAGPLGTTLSLFGTAAYTVNMNSGGGSQSFNADVSLGSTVMNDLMLSTGRQIRDSFSRAPMTGPAAVSGRRVTATEFAVPNSESTTPVTTSVIQKNATDGKVYFYPDVDMPTQVQVQGTGDASLSSTGHGFQIGPSNGANLIMDQNEIMVRNNGATSSLFINTDGGNIGLGADSSTVSIPGTLNAAYLPNHFAAGKSSSSSSVAAGGNTSVTVSFPSGRFSAAPSVVATCENGRFTAAVQGVSATGFTISLTNVTSGAGVPGTIHWHASDVG